MDFLSDSQPLSLQHHPISDVNKGNTLDDFLNMDFKSQEKQQNNVKSQHLDFNFVDYNPGSSLKKINKSDFDFTKQDSNHNFFIKSNGNQTNNIINIQNYNVFNNHMNQAPQQVFQNNGDKYQVFDIFGKDRQFF